MKKVIAVVLVVVLLATTIGMAGVALADPDKRGNDLPKGKSYNFNVIGVPNPKNANFDGGEGKRIFVLRTGNTWFYVQGGDSFEILDRNGTDGVVGGHGTAFPPGTEGTKGSPGIILPYASGEWKCDIYVRLCGPVDSSVKWKTYVYDGSAYIHLAEMEFTAEKSSKFSCKTSKLLADGYEDILWEMYDKNKFRIMQFRIFVDEA